MFAWWRKWQESKLLVERDATILIARFGVRASFIARRRLAAMEKGDVLDSNRPACHWRRVYSLTRQLLPFDGEDSPVVLFQQQGSSKNLAPSPERQRTHLCDVPQPSAH
jgi:hypothetical protein